MEIETLRLLINVVDQGSFAAAARMRNADPSRISRLIAGLEDDLGTRLLNRTTRALSLTEAGERFMANVRPLVDDFDAAVDAVQSKDLALRGQLRVSASVAFGTVVLVPMLRPFQERFPNLDIDLNLHDQVIDLTAARVDIAIRLGPAVRGDMVARRLRGVLYRLCAAPAYLAETTVIKTPSDIQAHACLAYGLPGLDHRWSFRSEDQDEIETVPIAPRTTISNALALREAARRGLGLALLADWLIADDLASGKLVDVLPDTLATPSTFDTSIWTVYPSRRFLPAKVRAFIDFLIERRV